MIGRISGILRGSYDVESFSYLSGRVNLPPGELLKALQSPNIRDGLVSEFGRDPKKFAYQLGIVLSSSSYDSFDSLVRTYTPIMSDDSRLSVRAYHPSWFLCDLSEKFLARSFDKENGLVVVNNYLLAKKRGYKAALCLQSFATKEGTFVKGNWYEPEGDVRIAVKKALSEGQTTLHLDEGSWVLMRAMNPGKQSDRLFDRALGFTRGEDVSPKINRFQRQIKQKAKVLIQGIPRKI